MNFKLKLTDAQVSALLEFYKDKQLPHENEHMKALFKKDDVTISLFNTNIVLFQGRYAENEKNFWQDTFNMPKDDEIVRPKIQTNYFKTSIGSDESGVGDYFGPLTVCAAYVQDKDRAFLESLKINDSKLLTDDHIRKIAPKLIKKIKYSLLVLSNPQYNKMISKGYNAHKLKAHLHAQCHRHLVSKIKSRPEIIIDQFCSEIQYKKYLDDFKKPEIPDIFLTKAETYFASVAVASIIARYSFITRLDKLGHDYDVTLLKGASKEVDMQAKNLVAEHGVAILDKIAKHHFKTTDKVLALLDK